MYNNMSQSSYVSSPGALYHSGSPAYPMDYSSPLEDSITSEQEHGLYSVSSSRSGSSYLDPFSSAIGKNYESSLDNLLDLSDNTNMNSVIDNKISDPLYGLGSGYLSGSSSPYDSLRGIIGERDIHLGFVDSSKDRSELINHASEVMDDIYEIFDFVTGDEFPQDVEINILDDEDFDKKMVMSSGSSNGSVMGFAKHSTPSYPANRIFIRKGSKAQILTVVGHELGHVLSERLGNIHDEEAKAIAFEYAWVNTIKRFDLAGISSMVRNFSLAKNGIHNIAQEFVEDMIKSGTEPIDIFDDLKYNNISVGNLNASILGHQGVFPIR